MANFTVKDPPEYNDEMRMLEPNDPGHANVFNPLIAQLLNNDAFLKAVTDLAEQHMKNGEIHVTNQDKEYWDRKAETTAATQSKPGLMSAGDKQKLDNVAANAEVNQNAFSNIQVGSVTITANGKTSTFTMEAGDNITLTADNATKKVTIKSNRDGGNAETLDGYHAEHFAAADHGHDGRYYTKTESDTLLKQKAASSHSHTKASITDFPSSMPANGGNADYATTAGAATKATQDGNGNNIANTYLPVNGNNAIKEVSTILKFGPTFGGICIDDYANTLSFAKCIRFFKDNLYNYVLGASGFTGSSGERSFHIMLQDMKDVVGSSIFFGKPIDETVYGIFGYNNYLNLGFSNNCFKTVYTYTGTVQASDREKKKDIKEFDDKFVEDFIMGLIPVSYMLRENESGRTHYGLIAQDVEELMDRLEMDSKDFAGFIKSPRYKETIEEIEVENEVEDEDGKKKIVKEKRQNVKATLIENEYEYALRYEEFISPIIKMLQILNNKLSTQQEEIGKLKTQIEELKVN